MLIASVSIQKTKTFPSYTPLWWCHTHKKKIRRFIYCGVSIFVLWLQYICFPRVKIPPWYFQLSAIGCGGLNRSVLRGQREKMKAGLICRSSQKPCCLFIPSYHADLCQMLGLTHAPPCVSGKSECENEFYCAIPHAYTMQTFSTKENLKPWPEINSSLFINVEPKNFVMIDGTKWKNWYFNWLANIE